MTNFEFYKDKILKTECIQEGTRRVGVSKKGEIKECSDLECEDCILNRYDSCSSALIKWLYEEYKKPIVLDDFEKELLIRVYNAGYVYIARNKDGQVYIHKHKPVKKGQEYWSDNTKGDEISSVIAEFDFLLCEDKEPTKISDLLLNKK